MCGKRIIKIADGIEMTVGEIVSEKVVITPLMAQQILKMYTDYLNTLTPDERQNQNRKIQMKRVRRYAKDMLNNNFNGTLNDDICFNKYGVIINGHHRLHALIEASKSNPNVTLEVFVKYNVPGDPNMDKGKARSDMDNLLMFSTNIPKNIIKACVDGTASFLLQNLGYHECSVTDKEAFYVYFSKQLSDLINQFTFQKGLRTFGATDVYAAVFVSYLNGVPITELNAFYTMLRTGQVDITNPHPSSNVVSNLHTWMLAESGKSSSSDKKERYFRILYAIKAFHEKVPNVKPGVRARYKDGKVINKFLQGPVYHITYNGRTF